MARTFTPLILNALYPSIERGLTADVVASRALGGRALTVCTTIVVAGDGRVTDVLDVPTDSVDAQLEHILATQHPDGVKIGIVGDGKNIPVLKRHLDTSFSGPILFDVTLSGPSGEDIASQRTLDAVVRFMSKAGLVTLRRKDAELIAAMEINSLDDAQVAVQRLEKRGARRVLLRCGHLPHRHFDDADTAEPFSVDLYYDGDDFALLEAPLLERPDTLHGASSAYTMYLLRALTQQVPVVQALQSAKAYVTDTLHASIEAGLDDAPDYSQHRTAVADAQG